MTARTSQLRTHALAAFFAWSLSCLGIVLPSGNSDEGHFQIKPEPIEIQMAEGTLFDWHVSTPTQQDAKLRDVTSSSPKHVGLKSVEHNTITASAKREGEASLHFEGEVEGQVVRDAFALRIVAPSRVELGECDAALKGLPAILPMRFVGKHTDDIAFGYGNAPLLISPPEAGAVHSQHRDPYSLRVDIAADAGEAIVLSSQLPDDPLHRRIPLLTGAALTHFTFPQLEAQLIRATPIGLAPTLRAEPHGRVCSQIDARVLVTTPDDCALRLADGTLVDEFTGALHEVAAEATRDQSKCSIRLEVVTAGLPQRLGLLHTLRFKQGVAATPSAPPDVGAGHVP